MCYRLQETFGKDCRVTIQKFTKNNSVVRPALVVRREGVCCSPVLYLDAYFCDYQRGIPEDVILKRMLEQYRSETSPVIPCPDSFPDADYLKEHAICRIVGQDGNESLLKEIPYRPVLNLAVVYYLEIELEGGDQAACLLRNEMLSVSGMTASQLDQYALQNTRKRYPCQFVSMNEMMRDLSDQPFRLNEETEEASAMYILTNEQHMYGAFWMSDPDELKKIFMMLGEDYYILPSSIHECIILRRSASSGEDELLHMVSEINAFFVSSEEVLADAVYYYGTPLCGLVRIR